MHIVDHIGMGVAIAMPDLGEMRMTGWKVIMTMLHDLGVVRRPDGEADADSDSRHGGKDDRGERQAERNAGPAATDIKRGF